MTNAPLEAGDELDWLVLHHVLDWKRGIAAFGEAPYRWQSQEFPALWPVSRDLGCAWRIVDHAIQRDVAVAVLADPAKPPLWRVTFTHPSGSEAHGEAATLPLAICHAALRAVEAAILVKSAGRIEKKTQL